VSKLLLLHLSPSTGTSGDFVICGNPKKGRKEGFFCFKVLGEIPFRKICGELFAVKPWICFFFFKILFLHGGITKSSRNHPLEKIILLFFWKRKHLLFL